MLLSSGEFDIHPPMPLTTSNAFGASADTVSSCALISVLDTRILLTPYPPDTSWNFAGRVLGCGASKQDVRLTGYYASEGNANATTRSAALHSPALREC